MFLGDMHDGDRLITGQATIDFQPLESEKTPAAINDLEDTIKRLSDEELRDKTVDFKQQIAQGATLDDLLIEAFATVREAGWRVLKMRHFDVQLIQGFHRGIPKFLQIEN